MSIITSKLSDVNISEDNLTDALLEKKDAHVYSQTALVSTIYCFINYLI